MSFKEKISLFSKDNIYIYCLSGFVALLLLFTFAILLLITVNSMSAFWPKSLAEYTLKSQSLPIIGELVKENENREQEGSEFSKLLLKIANRKENGTDYYWLDSNNIDSLTYPKDLVAIERFEWGDAYGRIEGLLESGNVLPFSHVELDQFLVSVKLIQEEIENIKSDQLTKLSYRLRKVHIELKQLATDVTLEKNKQNEQQTKINALEVEKSELLDELNNIENRILTLKVEMNRYALLLRISTNQIVEIPLKEVVDYWHPNQMNVFHKIGFYLMQWKRFLIEEPREANSEGGIFPAIFGTVMMVMLMTIFLTPLGVIAAIYLHEYANQNSPLTRFVRIGVNNLAGIPSVVYGVFGLGFFVYFIGAKVDQLFFSAYLPTPTFGTPGILWASLTLALLTVPILIVSTEEGLRRIPSSLKEASYALHQA